MGILQRYVVGEILRAFVLALLTMTAIFVLFMVAAQARDIGLSPDDISHLVPYVVPSTLPYTIPVSLLFAATVIYGRLAEATTRSSPSKPPGSPSGQSSGPQFSWPLVSVCGFSTQAAAGSLAAPTAPRWSSSMISRTCSTSWGWQRDREVNFPKWPFLIKVRDVQGTKMIDATFKHKVKGGIRLRRHHPGAVGRAAFRCEGKAGASLPPGRGIAAVGARCRRLSDQRQHSCRFRSRPIASSIWRRRSRNLRMRRSRSSSPRTVNSSARCEGVRRSGVMRFLPPAAIRN